MRVGVDTSVIVAAVHANHPLHVLSSTWLDAALRDDHVVVAHHSILEAYAVLTRLPAPYRVTPIEAERVLGETIRPNAEIASFASASIWDLTARIANSPASGGAAYDAFIIELFSAADVEAIVTFNVADFRRLAGAIPISDPVDLSTRPAP
ncbi:MAG: PIN domain-containing protein [Spirochaetales bacterium]|nr:PIN domain-containing protein [Spirochaetales bacterium]